MADSNPLWVRLTRVKLSALLTFLFLLGLYGGRLSLWGFRRLLKPVAYHPIAWPGLVLVGSALIMNLMLGLYLLMVGMLALTMWYRWRPASFRRHAEPRLRGFLLGFRYRYRPRRRLTACALLNKEDPVPTISTVRQIGCTSSVRIRMVDGDEINFWRKNAARVAQTYSALDCKVNPYRRDNFLTIRPDGFTRRPPYVKVKFGEKVTKPRWVQLELLTKDPFSSKLGVEYVDYHQAETLSPVVATLRTGEPHTDNLAAHRLRVAMTRWGKSNAIRATLYAQRHNIASGLLENWLIDGKGGVEGSFFEHQIARWAYGDVEADPEGYDPSEFDQLLQDAVTVMMRRQKAMRGFATEHIPTPAAPWLRIIIDEILVLTSKNLLPDIRKRIAANVNLIFQQGVACGVTIDASSQLGTKDDLDPINRGGFTEFELGKVEQGVVDMIFGRGWWERGAKCDEIPDDLKGVFYRKTESTMAPHEIRYPYVSVADLDTMQPVDESVLWPKAVSDDDMGFA